MGVSNEPAAGPAVPPYRARDGKSRNAWVASAGRDPSFGEWGAGRRTAAYGADAAHGGGAAAYVADAAYGADAAF